MKRIRGGALAIGGLLTLDLAGREIARRSVVHGLLGWTPSIGFVVAAAIVLGAMAILARRTRKAVPVLLTLFTIGLALQLQLGARLQSDGFYYFAYLRSITFDRDVDFTNDYRMLGLGDKTNLFQPTRTGHAQSAWTIGPAIVWSPFFAVGHLTAKWLHSRGRDVSVDGTSFPYRQAVCVAGLFYGLLGCWIAFRFSRRFYAVNISAASVALTICGSFMLWYFVKEPSMTHAPSFAAVAAFLLVWLDTHPAARGGKARTLTEWAILGLLAGFMSLIRWQNALFMLLPGIDACRGLLGSRGTRGNVIVGGAIFVACATAAFLPQMIAWKSIYGSFVARSPVGPAIRWTDPHVSDILWSARNGLLSTTPILYLGLLGLLAFALVEPVFGLPIILTLLVMTYFNACIQDWWGSAGFGGRRFDGTIPFFCLGLAAFVEYGARLVRRHAVAAVTTALAILACWNLALMGAANQGSVRIGETLPFDRAWAAQAYEIHSWVGNPFTYPASLLFALRNSASPGDYDVLWTDRFLGDPLRPYARVDVGADDETYIEEGWHAPEREGTITYRWAASPAVLRVPLDHAASLRVQVRLHAFAYPGSSQQTVTIAANGHTCAPLPVTTDWQTVECTLPANAWFRGLNRLSLDFAYVQRPLDVHLGGDARALAAAVDWIRFSVQ
jgi:hypothetical protein